MKRDNTSNLLWPILCGACLLPTVPSRVSAAGIWNAPAPSNECTARWIKAPQIPYISPAYPENNASYWMFNFEYPQGSNEALHITGQFPHARYMSFVMYDFDTGNTVDAIEDHEVEPSQGHANPFRVGVPRDTPARDYGIWVVPQGSSHDGDANTLVIPAGVESVSIFYRVYLPDDGADDTGNVGSPVVKAYEQVAGSPVSCPAFAGSIPPSVTDPDSGRDGLPPLDDEIIESYRPEGEVGLFGNANSPYLFSPLLRNNDGQVAVIRFRAPSFPATTGGGGQFEGDEEVRYWSVCMGGVVSTATSTCLHDEAIRIDENGWVRIVVGPVTLGAAATARGWNFIPWGLHAYPVLLFRQMLPTDDFAGSFQDVPPGGVGSQSIGPYAPQGQYCTPTEFRLDGCGY